MGTGNSLLLTLLTSDQDNRYPITLQAFADAGVDTNVPNANDVMNNVNIVVDKIQPLPQGTPNLMKNVAQKELYEVLYSIIEKEYEEPDHEPETPAGIEKAQKARELNRTLTSAIGMALEMALKNANAKNATKDDDIYGSIITLRDELRKIIFKALTPK